MTKIRSLAVKKTLLVLAGASLFGGAQAGALYFDFNKNTIGSQATASLFLFGTAGQTATVSNLDGFTQNVTFGANGFFNLAIPNTFQQSGTGTRTSGFEVQSSSAIAGYFINRAGFSTDMTYLLDRASLGREYVVASQGTGFGEGSQVAIHAIVDNTTITFTPSVGAAVTVNLNAGQTYKYAGGAANLTGSFVSASQDVAVFSGHECAQVPSGTSFCDTLIEQAIPTDKLSRNYLLTATRGAELASQSSDLVRVIATVNGTEVRVDGVVVATLNKGQFHEFSLGQGTGARVEASQAVSVAQYLKGGGGANTDPAMSYVPGQDTWLKEYRLATPSGGAAFNVNYASIVIAEADLASLALDGLAVDTSSFNAIGTTGFRRGSVSLPLGLFNLTAANPFLVMLGGGSSADSYLTYGGSTFAPGVSPPPPPTGIPTPGSLSLALTALVGLGLIRKRQRA